MWWCPSTPPSRAGHGASASNQRRTAAAGRRQTVATQEGLSQSKAHLTAVKGTYQRTERIADPFFGDNRRVRCFPSPAWPRRRCSTTSRIVSGQGAAPGARQCSAALHRSLALRRSDPRMGILSSRVSCARSNPSRTFRRSDGPASCTRKRRVMTPSPRPRSVFGFARARV
jgi:hypothetical protein